MSGARKPKYADGQVVMLVPMGGGIPQPAVFRCYEDGQVLVDFAGKGFKMSGELLRPLTHKERGTK